MSKLGRIVSKEDFYGKLGNRRITDKEAADYIEGAPEFDVYRRLELDVNPEDFEAATQAAQQKMYGQIRSNEVATPTPEEVQRMRSIPLSSPINPQAAVHAQMEKRIDPVLLQQLIRGEQLRDQLHCTRRVRQLPWQQARRILDRARRQRDGRSSIFKRRERDGRSVFTDHRRWLLAR